MGVREALLIATSAYTDPHFNGLNAPGHDIKSLKRVLAKPAIGDYKVRTAQDKPSHVIRRMVQEFLVRRRTGDQLLVYFSCHGIKDDDGELYFAGTDTEHDPDMLDSSAVSAAFVSRQLKRCVARSIVVLLDCCYSGAFDPGAKRDTSINLRERFDGTGIAILTATNALQYAWEGDHFAATGEGHLSAFTSSIVEGLRTGDADIDGDGLVSIDDLYGYGNDRIRVSCARQTPKRWLLNGEGNLIIARSVKIHSAPEVGANTSINLSAPTRVSPPQASPIQIDCGVLGHPGGAILTSGNKEVYAVAFSPDGRTLATTGDDDSVRLWDPVTKKEIPPPWKMPYGDYSYTAIGRRGTTCHKCIYAMAFSPDGRILATAGADCKARLWDSVTGEPVGDPLTGHTDVVHAVAFSSDGHLLATAGDYSGKYSPYPTPDDWGEVRLWNPSNGTRVGEPITSHHRAFKAVAFSPDGHLLATAETGGVVRLWDPITSQPVGNSLIFEPVRTSDTDFISAARLHAVQAVVFSPDGRFFAAACGDGAARLWDPATGALIGDPLTGHTNSVLALAFSPDSRLLATAGADSKVRLWDLADGEPLGDPLTGHNDRVWAVAFSPSGDFLATGSEDKTVRFWPVPKAQLS